MATQVLTASASPTRDHAHWQRSLFGAAALAPCPIHGPAHVVQAQSQPATAIGLVDGYIDDAAIPYSKFVKQVSAAIESHGKFENLGTVLLDRFGRSPDQALVDVFHPALLQSAGAGIDSVITETPEIQRPVQAAFTPNAAADWFRSLQIVTPEKFAGLNAAARGNAWTMAGASQTQLLTDVHAASLRALEEGRTYSQWSADIQGSLAQYYDPPAAPGHLQTVFRAAMGNAYSVQRSLLQQQAARFRPYGVYRTVADDRVRDQHESLHGQIWRLDHPIWGQITPPNGYNCRCRRDTLSQRQFDAGGHRLSTISDENAVLDVHPDWRHNPAAGAKPSTHTELLSQSKQPPEIPSDDAIPDKLEPAEPPESFDDAPPETATLRADEPDLTPADAVADIYNPYWDDINDLDDIGTRSDWSADTAAAEITQRTFDAVVRDGQTPTWPGLDRLRLAQLARNTLTDPQLRLLRTLIDGDSIRQFEHFLKSFSVAGRTITIDLRLARRDQTINWRVIDGNTVPSEYSDALILTT